MDDKEENKVRKNFFNKTRRYLHVYWDVVDIPTTVSTREEAADMYDTLADEYFSKPPQTRTEKKTRFILSLGVCTDTGFYADDNIQNIVKQLGLSDKIVVDAGSWMSYEQLDAFVDSMIQHGADFSRFKDPRISDNMRYSDWVMYGTRYQYLWDEAAITSIPEMKKASVDALNCWHRLFYGRIVWANRYSAVKAAIYVVKHGIPSLRDAFIKLKLTAKQPQSLWSVRNPTSIFETMSTLCQGLGDIVHTKEWCSMFRESDVGALHTRREKVRPNYMWYSLNSEEIDVCVEFLRQHADANTLISRCMFYGW